MQQQRTMRRIVVLLILTALAAVAARGQEPLTLDSCRKLASAQNRKLQAIRMNEEMGKNLIRAMRTLYLPRFDFAGGWYYMGQKNVVPFANDIFLPIVPYEAINQASGMLDPAYFENNPLAALDYLVIDLSKLQPKVDRNGQPLFKRYAFLPGAQLNLKPQHLWIMGFTVRQPIFMGLKIVAANKMAEAMGSMARSKTRAAEAETIEKCDAAYWRALSLQEKNKLAIQYEALLARFEADVQNLLDEGMATRNDLLKVQTRRNEARMQKLRTGNGQTLARMALAQMLGIRLDQAVVSNADLDSLALADAGRADSTAEAERPEIASLRSYQQLLQAGLMMVNSSYMPDIYLFGQYSWKHPNPYAGLTKTFGGDWSVGVTLRWSLLTWGERIYKTRMGRLKLAQAEAELEEAESLIALQQMQKRQLLSESRQRIEYATQAANRAAENLTAVQATYAEGASSLRDVLEAQTLWQEAQQELLDAKLEAANARTSLRRADGNLCAPQPPAKGAKQDRTKD